MLDPSNMYPKSFHPAEISRSKDFRRKAKWYTRTRRPTKYVLIDFGLSRRYDPTNGPPLDKPYRGGDKSAPELQERVTPCNPFPTDVYYLGNLYAGPKICSFLRTSRADRCIQKCKGFEFMEALVTDMVQDDPTKRPTMDKVVARFSEIRGKLNSWKLRSRIARKNELWPVTATRPVPRPTSDGSTSQRSDELTVVPSPVVSDSAPPPIPSTVISGPNPMDISSNIEPTQPQSEDVRRASRSPSPAAHPLPAPDLDPQITESIRTPGAQYDTRDVDSSTPIEGFHDPHSLALTDPDDSESTSRPEEHQRDSNQS